MVAEAGPKSSKNFTPSDAAYALTLSHTENKPVNSIHCTVHRQSGPFVAVPYTRNGEAVAMRALLTEYSCNQMDG